MVPLQHQYYLSSSQFRRLGTGCLQDPDRAKHQALHAASDGLEGEQRYTFLLGWASRTEAMHWDLEDADDCAMEEGEPQLYNIVHPDGADVRGYSTAGERGDRSGKELR